MDTQTLDMIERMARFFERDDMPRIAGRMLGCLLLSPEPRSLDELAETLQASKSSVSTDARWLERLEKVERVTIPGDRRDYYRIAANLPRRMGALWLERLDGMRTLLEEALDTPAAEEVVVARRLHRGIALMEELVTAVEETGQRFREQLAEEDGERAAEIA